MSQFDSFVTGYPEEIDHYGFIFKRNIRFDDSGNLLMKYECVNYPHLPGPEIAVTTPNPTERQVNEFKFAFFRSVNLYLSKFVMMVFEKTEPRIVSR